MIRTFRMNQGKNFQKTWIIFVFDLIFYVIFEKCPKTNHISKHIPLKQYCILNLVNG